MLPWCPSLSWASINTVYLHDFGMTRVRNLLPEFVTGFNISAFEYVNVSVSCLGAVPFKICLEMHLQKGSVCCMCTRVSNLSAERDLGVGLGSLGMSGSMCGGDKLGMSRILFHLASCVECWSIFLNNCEHIDRGGELRGVFYQV